MRLYCYLTSGVSFQFDSLERINCPNRESASGGGIGFTIFNNPFQLWTGHEHIYFEKSKLKIQFSDIKKIVWGGDFEGDTDDDFVLLEMSKPNPWTYEYYYKKAEELRKNYKKLQDEVYPNSDQAEWDKKYHNRTHFLGAIEDENRVASSTNKDT